MCGFAGFIGLPQVQNSSEEIDALLRRMGRSITHRGPDDEGVWSDLDAGLGLVHRRLSIVDLSHAGHQPMASASGRYVIAYNGEIYNHRDLRAELDAAGHTAPWRGHSDTEILLAGVERWGLDATLRRSVGMFALALWDRQSRQLTLGRDRLGEKPLYYGWQGTSFLFGSELKALRQHPAFEDHLDRDALCLYLRHNYVPAPRSIYEGISKLPPGAVLTVSLAQREPLIQHYWRAIDVARQGKAHPFNGSERQAIDELEQLLTEAVANQMMADVPLGAFLSGGVDSSLIVALMQKQSTRPIKTFTIGFDVAAYNEAEHAKAVSHHLRTDHTELYVTPRQALDVVPLLPHLYDEPFSDSSQIPTYLVSKLARSQVTVSLSGDAGDELFGGYNRYLLADRMWARLSALPMPLRTGVARGLLAIAPELWNRTAALVAPVLPRRWRQVNAGDKLHKLAGVLGESSVDALYHALVSHWHDPAAVVVGGRPTISPVLGLLGELDGFDSTQRMMLLDLQTYLPDDILVKVDRASMGVSLESRVPLLDHRVVEFAWRLPRSMKIRNGQTKWPLRQVLYRHVPRELIERPKTGFGVPLDSWLRGPLRDWAETLLDESRLRAQAYFDAKVIRQTWDEHQSGKRNWQYHLWDILMFQSWLDHTKA